VANVPNRQRDYNEVAGSSIHRLAGLADGIFAVGMTLLVLGLAVPAMDTVKSEGDLLRQLGGLLPAVVTYFMSFLTLGIFWVAQQTQLGRLERANRNFTWIHLGFLLAVTLIPFSTLLLARFHWSRVALVEYWLNIFLLGALILVAAEYAARNRLFNQENQQTIMKAVRRRVYVAQSLYLLATLLCIVDTRLSIGLIVLIQLNYAIAPRVAFLHRL